MSTQYFRARWILPVDRPPIENGLLAVRDGRIVEVRPAAAHDPAGVDFGDVALLPGLVNTHTHLELTSARGRVPFHGSFTDWILRLPPRVPAERDPEELASAYQHGLIESLASGVTALADIGIGPQAVTAWDTAPIHVAGFLELLGMGPRRFSEHPRSLAAAMQALSATPLPAELLDRPSPPPAAELLRTVGLTPHAPYSTDPLLYRQALRFCTRTRTLLMTHLAETPEETEFLVTGTGIFRELLERFDLWDGSFEPPGCSPVEFAHRIGLLDRAPILAHVNYVSDSDLDLLARSPASVVYCPRTHVFFRHAPHRYREMLARGINVCLGTDSLASNHTLSILDEMRHLRRHDPDVATPDILRMATLNGARALGWEAHIGSLTAGKRADFITIPLEHPGATDPAEDVLSGDRPVASVHLHGQTKTA